MPNGLLQRLSACRERWVVPQLLPCKHAQCGLMPAFKKDSDTGANGFSDDFLEYTKEVWKPILGAELSTEEAREIAENLIGLELYLRELKDKYGAAITTKQGKE